MAHHPRASRLASDDVWDEIELLVSQAAQFARGPMSDRELLAELLGRAMQATTAVAAAAWRLQLDAETVHLEYRSAGTSPDEPLVQAAVAGRMTAPLTIGGRGSSTGIVNRSHLPLIIAPVPGDERASWLFALWLDEDSSPAMQAGAAEVLAAFAEIAADFHQQRELRELRARDRQWRDLQQFALAAQDASSPLAAAMTIANDAAHLTNCNRVAVLWGWPTRQVARAITGVPLIDRRSPLVGQMQQLAAVVVRGGEAWWDDESSREDQRDHPLAPPALRQASDAYQDASHARAVAVLPFSLDGVQHGALLFERQEGGAWSDAQRRGIEQAARHAIVALRNAHAAAAIPLAGLWRRGRRWSAQWLGWRGGIASAVVLAAAVLAAVWAWLPAPFEIAADGELVPRVRHDLFAPADGVVEALHLPPAGRVAAGQELLTLRSADLDLQTTQLLGELQTAQAQLQAAVASRVALTMGSPNQRFQSDALAADEERLRAWIKSLEAQHELLRTRAAELVVRSPIAGELLTWQPEQLLAGRPVKMGQRLLSVGQLTGDWLLELRVADRDIRHVRKAFQQAGGEMPLAFVMASQAGATWRGRVEQIHLVSECDARGRPTVRVVAACSRPHAEATVLAFRPGTQVFARLDCGRRGRGFVWFRDLIEMVSGYWWSFNVERSAA